MAEVEVAVPSHSRVATVAAKTLRVLAEGGVPAEHVRLFVTPAQVDEYREKVDPRLVGEILPGAAGLAAQRRAIHAWYPEGTRLVQMDDDVAEVRRRVDDKTLESVGDLAGWFAAAFDRCAAEGAFLWGVYPVVNPMFMKATVTTDLRFCIGQLWGVINRHDPELQVELANKEDYERTLRYWKRDGVVVRFNDVAAKSKMFGPGGLQADDQPDRHDLNRREVRWLLEHYPEHVRVAKRRSQVGLEVRLVG